MMQKEIRYSWGQYQKEMAPLIDTIILIFGIFSILVGTIQVVIKSPNTGAIIINISFGIIGVLIYIFKKYIKVTFKVVLTLILGIISVVDSLLSNGLMSTGFLTLVILILLLTIFFHIKISIFFSLAGIAGIVLFAWFLKLGYFSYPEEISKKMNDMNQWIPTISTFIVIIIVILSSIHLLKSKMMKNITKLEFSNIKLKDQKKKLKKLAYYDSLTTLANRTKFVEIFHKRKLDGRLKSGFIVQANIKQFRIMNSILGVTRADEILKEIGKLFAEYSHLPNFAARLIGDEFIFWIEVNNEQDLTRYMVKFKEYLNKALAVSVPDFHIDFHFSASKCENGKISMEQCLSNTDIALRSSKKTPEVFIVFYSDNMMSEIELEMDLLGKLKRAITNESFDIHYQKKVNINSGEYLGVEALCRWQLDDGSFICPEVFIPVLNNNNLMVPFGHLIIKKIFCDMDKIIHKYGDSITVSINISPIQFLSNGFVDFLIMMIHKYSIHSERIMLEITEDVFIEDIHIIQDIIKELKAIGIKISVDDFGKGFSSLSYLSNIDLNELKIDKSFIDDIATNDKQFKIVQSICSIANALNFKVVAEGVERIEQLEKLKETSCHIVQGFYFSKPEKL